MAEGESRTPHGVRELKLLDETEGHAHGSRTPHGVRELKLLLLRVLDASEAVAPRTGCVN